MSKFRHRDEISHFWVRERGINELYSGNMSCYPDKMYSYGTVIARIVPGRKGQEAFLVSSYAYSNTTRRHINSVWSAISRYETVFEVPSVDANHKENIEHYASEIKSYVNRSVRAIKHSDWYITQASKTQKEAKEYIEFFRVKSKLNTMQKRIIYQDLGSEEFLADALEKVKTKKKADLVKAKLANKKAVKRDALNVKKWKALEINYTNFTFDKNIYLRFNPKKDLIQTSRNASMSVKNAKILYLLIKRDKEIKDKEFDGYKVSYNSKKLQIGCHKIEMAEIESLAKKMGW